jgi:hypothetical protein
MLNLPHLNISLFALLPNEQKPCFFTPLSKACLSPALLLSKNDQAFNVIDHEHLFLALLAYSFQQIRQNNRKINIIGLFRLSANVSFFHLNHFLFLDY